MRALPADNIGSLCHNGLIVWQDNLVEVKNIMPRLLIKCPECKAIVDTGVSMELASFCSSELENNTIVCHSYTCGKEIVWSKDDVLAMSFCNKITV